MLSRFLIGNPCGTDGQTDKTRNAASVGRDGRIMKCCVSLQQRRVFHTVIGVLRASRE